MKMEKSVWPGFALRFRRRTERFLEKQARKGWMFHGFGGFGWKFRRAEPKQLHFSVVYFPEPKEDDIPARNRLEEFREFCAHDGWQFAASSDKMQVFYSEKENPIPIETDAALEVENIFHARWLDTRGMLVLGCGLLPLVVLLMWITNGGSIVSLLTHQKSMWTIFLALFIAVYSVLDACRLRLWYAKAKRHAKERGEFLDETRFWILMELLTYGAPFLIFGALVYIAGWKVFLWRMGTFGLIILALLLVLGWIAERTPDKKKRIRRWVIFGTLIWTLGLEGSEVLSEKWNVDFDLHAPENSAWTQYMEVPPISFEDAEGYTITLRETGLLARYQAVGKGTCFSCTVLEVKAGIFYDLCLNEILPGQYFEVDAACWGAEKVYQSGTGQNGGTMSWILCYEDRILELRLLEMPTPEQMALIGSTLGNEQKFEKSKNK